MAAEPERLLAFEREVLPHLDAAFRLARALTGRAQDAEDLVQDATLRAFAGFDGYRRGTNARAWLLTIVRRTYLNDRRRAEARPRTVSLEGDGDHVGRHAPADPLVPSPEEEVLRTVDRELVLAALAGLPEPYRTALALVDMEGLRYAEAASVLGCPIGTVMSRLARGRRALYERLRSGAAGETLALTSAARREIPRPRWALRRRSEG
jgi:RNA polymerase sigma-70 factor (ECF subfamily)